MTMPDPVKVMIEKVARAIANAMNVDPDVYIGMHGKYAWENQWHPIAKEAIEAVQSEAATLLSRMEQENVRLRTERDNLLSNLKEAMAWLVERGVDPKVFGEALAIGEDEK